MPLNAIAVKDLMKLGANVTVHTSSYPQASLIEFADLAGKSNLHLTVRIDNDIMAPALKDIVNKAPGRITIDFT